MANVDKPFMKSMYETLKAEYEKNDTNFVLIAATNDGKTAQITLDHGGADNSGYLMAAMCSEYYTLLKHTVGQIPEAAMVDGVANVIKQHLHRIRRQDLEKGSDDEGSKGVVN